MDGWIYDKLTEMKQEQNLIHAKIDMIIKKGYPELIDKDGKLKEV